MLACTRVRAQACSSEQTNECSSHTNQQTHTPLERLHPLRLERSDFSEASTASACSPVSTPTSAHSRRGFQRGKPHGRSQSAGKSHGALVPSPLSATHDIELGPEEVPFERWASARKRFTKVFVSATVLVLMALTCLATITSVIYLRFTLEDKYPND
eukprot:133565-Pleurochrysis_carterae.AAC.1